MSYYAKSNIKYDNNNYQRGDEILALRDADVAGLLEAGVIQEEPIEVVAPAQVEDTPVADPKPQLENAGHERVKSGEPSLDKDRTDGEGVKKEAEDVTPGEPGFVARMFGAKSAGTSGESVTVGTTDTAPVGAQATAPETSTEPKIDPSEGL